MPVLTDEARQVKSQLLTAMRRELEAVVMPELNTAYAKLAATWVCQTIDYFLLEEHPDAQVIAARDALLAKLSGEAAKAGDYLPELRDPHRAVDAICAALRRTGAQTSPETIGAIGAMSRRALAEETRFLEEHRVAALERMNTIEVAASPERFDQFFNSTVEYAGYRTVNIVRTVGGYSRDTFLVAARSPHGATAEFAVRRDLPFGPVEGSAADEFKYLERLLALGVRVAKPLAAVHDRSFLGEPFLVTERVPGVTATEPMSADRAVGESGAREMARMLARLHAIDPRAAGLAVISDDPRAQITATLDYWRTRWNRYRCIESDVMEAAFIWLEGNLPRNVARNVIVHGDYRPDNAMMDDGQITAMLDWEFIHPGDSAEDVEYMRLFVKPFLAPDEFTKEYLAAGGVEFEPSSSDFYEVFRSVRNVVCTDTSWHGFLNGLYPSMRLSFQGVFARRMLLMHLAAALERVSEAGGGR